MLIKEADSKQEPLDILQGLLERPDLNTKQKKTITQELNIMRAGIKGERDAAYEIDFHFKSSKNYIVLHDLRLEVNGRIAQIDHLVIDRTLEVYIFETKHFSSGIKIAENGEFLRWNNYNRSFEGMASPLAQNDRHMSVLKDFFANSEMPTRFGMKLIPKIIPLVLISNNARIDRPKSFDTSSVLKCEALLQSLNTSHNPLDIKSTFSAVGRIVSRETLQKIGRLLRHSHKPILVNYAGKFGIPKEAPITNIEKSSNVKITKPKDLEKEHHCSKCNSANISVLHGRYGYYFKCQDCSGNTAIKLQCKGSECKPRLRKQKTQFFKECAQCGSSHLFFENTEIPQPA